MAEAQERSRRKNTGGMYRPNSKRKKRNLKGEFAATQLSDERAVKKRKTRGSTKKLSLKKEYQANISTDDGKTVQAEIESVEGNKAHPDFVRRDILTKGTIIETSEGKARITSRPGQDGIVNAEMVADDR